MVDSILVYEVRPLAWIGWSRVESAFSWSVEELPFVLLNRAQSSPSAKTTPEEHEPHDWFSTLRQKEQMVFDRYHQTHLRQSPRDDRFRFFGNGLAMI